MEEIGADLGEPAYVVSGTGKRYPLSIPRWRSATGEPLSISDLPGIGRDQIRTEIRSIWRYAAALPLVVEDPISLGEGWTPLVRRPWARAEPLFKLEWFAPTCSFKDRGASVMVSVLRQQGVDWILEDSSGNGGAAIAAYAAAGGMKATILTPASTSPAKTVQMLAHGAQVELVPGTRQDTADAAVARSSEIFYASHNWQAFFLQGVKTLAYELWEQLGFRAPDNIVVPVGAGSNILGCDLAFSELLRRGEIERRPRLFAVQPRNCAPIVAAFRAGGEAAVPVEVAPTLAEGAAIAHPVRLGPVLQAIRRSGGAAVAVDDAEILRATLDLAKIGLFAEPTSAMAAAAYAGLLDEGVVGREETTVLVLTGSGAKATQTVAGLL